MNHLKQLWVYPVLDADTGHKFVIVHLLTGRIQHVTKDLHLASIIAGLGKQRK